MLMSIGAIGLKYFQECGASGYSGSRCQFSYFKWNTVNFYIFECNGKN